MALSHSAAPYPADPHLADLRLTFADRSHTVHLTGDEIRLITGRLLTCAARLTRTIDVNNRRDHDIDCLKRVWRRQDLLALAQRLTDQTTDRQHETHPDPDTGKDHETGGQTTITVDLTGDETYWIINALEHTTDPDRRTLALRVADQTGYPLLRRRELEQRADTILHKITIRNAGPTNDPATPPAT